MVRQNRILAVHKGEELLATGTADELAEHFNVTRKTIFHWVTPRNHKRNTGGKRKVATYIDEDRLPLRHHQTVEIVHRFYEKEQRGILPKEIAIEMGLPNPSFTSQITKILRRLIELGFVEKVQGKGNTYVPTSKMDEYVDEFCEMEAEE